jgi:iron complex transport system permease protein
VVWAWLSGGTADVPATVQTVVLNVRGPRILAAVVVGAALSAAGAAYQSLFRNPLVSPDILGVSSGAALGAVLGIFFSLDVVFIQALAFGCGLAAVATAYFIAARMRGHDPILVLVLAGVVIGALLGAGVALIKYLADPYKQLPAPTFYPSFRPPPLGSSSCGCCAGGSRCWRSGTTKPLRSGWKRDASGRR